MNDIESGGYLELLADIKQRIRSAQYEALRAVNKELIGLYWDIGRIIQERQKGNTWGKAVVEHLADDLQKEFPGIQGFSARNIWYMRDFYITYFENKKLQPLVAEISWTKHLIIMAQCKDDLEREFYITATKKFGWTKNVLIHQIENKSYEKYLLNQTNFDKTVPDRRREMSEWKEIITTRKSSFAVGLARSICSINCMQQRIEKSQQAVGQISSQALLHSEKPIAKQAVSQFETKIGQHVVAQLVQIPRRDFLLCSGLKNHRERRVHREKLHRSVLSVYSVVEKPGSNSLFQEKLKSLGIEWR